MRLLSLLLVTRCWALAIFIMSPIERRLVCRIGLLVGKCPPWLRSVLPSVAVTLSPVVVPKSMFLMCSVLR